MIHSYAIAVMVGSISRLAGRLGARSLAFLLLTSSLGLSAPEQPNFSVQISTPKATYRAGAEVEINVALTNLSPSPVPMPPATTPPEYVGCDIIVRRSGPVLESAVQMTPYLWGMKKVTGRLTTDEKAITFDQNTSFGRLHTGEQTVVAPSQVIHYTALLNDLYEIATPGTYHVEAIYYGRKHAPGVPAHSNVLTLTITDPPPPAISIQISTVSGALAFTAGSVIDIAISVRNDSSVPVQLPVAESDAGLGANGYRFIVKRGLASANFEQPVKKAGLYVINDQWQDYNYNYHDLTQVQPDQTLHYQPANVSEMFDMNIPGFYTIRVEKVDPVTHLPVQSNTIELEVR